MLEMSGSDLHHHYQFASQIRVHGHLVPLDLPQMTPAGPNNSPTAFMTDSQKHRFEKVWARFFFRIERPGPLPRQCISISASHGPAVFR